MIDEDDRGDKSDGAKQQVSLDAGEAGAVSR
jgi:hypothetical protein